MFGSLKSHLETPISIQSLVVVRVAFGLILAWDCWRYIHYDRIYRYYVEPDMLFPFLPFIHPLPEPYIYIVWGGVGLFGIMVAVGLFYRFSVVALTVIFAYFFLLDRAQYLNHNYMVILYGTLLCFMPAGRAYSLDAIIFPHVRTYVIPRWPVSAIKLQTEIILIYAGWVKIADDWLRGEPLRMWLQDDGDKIFYGFLFQYDVLFVVAAWGTVLLHILGAPLLLWHRTRLAVFLVYAFFHWSNAQLFNIGIFPWITLALTTVFFAPDWPQRLVYRAFRFAGAAPDIPPLPNVSFKLSRAVTVGLVIWFTVQVYLPERQLLFNNNVAWTGDGHRFSWRMRIYSRQREGVFRIVSAERNVIWTIDPYDHMARRQARNVLARPDIVWMYAQQLERIWAADGYPGVSVYADIRVSLNGRPMQQFTDASVDLTKEAWSPFGPTNWIFPLEGRVSLDWLLNS
ncbi:HTTM domain-containing protein [Yoonia sp. 2307UL14-13]|uniref:HTTM domain-containing protein n=1 Tax=Yoonia sp. 2307UL14-13 TaxID=3126506 RepID=UPI0030A69173